MNHEHIMCDYNKKVNLNRNMCDFIRKQKNNMNKFCIHKPHMHKEYNMCDIIRNLKNQFEQEYETFVHVNFLVF